MTKVSGLIEKLPAAKVVDPEYRAVTQTGDRDQWAVVDDHGCVIFRGNARAAAMIAGRLTRPAR